MARANLRVHEGLSEAFLSSQSEGSNTRLLKVAIISEEMHLSSLVSKIGTAESDFQDVLLACVGDTEAAIFLYCLSDSAGVKNWLLLAWIPDACRVRDKMIFSSSKEDLKRSLGQGYFSSEYSANSRGDLTWGGFQESLRKERSPDMLSFSERTVMEERQASHAMMSTTKSSAMSVLPFTPSPELVVALASFQRKEGCNMVEMTVDGDSISLVSSKTVTVGPGSSLQPYVSEIEARFFALRLDAGVSLFVYSCPEVVPIRQKMIMASAKATVLATMSDKGLIFDRNIEIRDPADIDEMLRLELEPDSSGPSSAAASLGAKKPARPGQKSRTVAVAKFSLEE